MIVAGGRDPSLGARDSEGPPAFEDLVPTPIFSGQVQFNTPNPISFAPATTELATPMTHGTLMADFTAEPRVLRSGDDTFLTGNFTELVITWPGLEDEQRTPMANIIGGRDHISRAELARFVVDQFSLITSVDASSSPEWRLGDASDAYNVKNTSLAFLWSPAPGVWQPAFRVRNRLDNIGKEPVLS